MFDKEKYDVVNEHDVVMYSIYGKKALHSMGKGQYHRSIHILIEVVGGRFVTQLKAEGTENAGKWSSAVSGHVLSGETYIEAAIREAKEELGLTINKSELDKVAIISPCEDTGQEFVCVYTYLMDDKDEIIKPNSDEVKEVNISMLEDVVADIKINKDKYSPAFRLAMDLFIHTYQM